MRIFSRINFPSLYFWLSSLAKQYCHPITLKQLMHATSLTTCTPVINHLSSSLVSDKIYQILNQISRPQGALEVLRYDVVEAAEVGAARAALEDGGLGGAVALAHGLTLT